MKGVPASAVASLTAPEPRQGQDKTVASPGPWDPGVRPASNRPAASTSPKRFAGSLLRFPLSFPGPQALLHLTQVPDVRFVAHAPSGAC